MKNSVGDVEVEICLTATMMICVDLNKNLYPAATQRVINLKKKWVSVYLITENVEMGCEKILGFAVIAKGR